LAKNQRNADQNLCLWLARNKKLWKMQSVKLKIHHIHKRKKNCHTYPNLRWESNLDQHATILYRLGTKEKRGDNVKITIPVHASTMTCYQLTRWRWQGFPLMNEKPMFLSCFVLWSKLPTST
jgi:hypothetical protein